MPQRNNNMRKGWSGKLIFNGKTYLKIQSSKELSVYNIYARLCRILLCVYTQSYIVKYGWIYITYLFFTYIERDKHKLQRKEK